MKPGEAHDATIAVDALLELMERVPSLRAGLRGLVYDMALSDADYDRLMDAGLIPVEKVRRRNDGSRAAEALGPHDFKTRQGHKDARPAGGETHKGAGLLRIIERLEHILAGEPDVQLI